MENDSPMQSGARNWGSGVARLRCDGSQPRITVDGPIDALNAGYIGWLVRRAHEEHDGRIDLDTSHVPFVTAAGLGMLVQCATTVRLTGPTALLRRELALTGLSDVLELADAG